MLGLGYGEMCGCGFWCDERHQIVYDLDAEELKASNLYLLCLFPTPKVWPLCHTLGSQASSWHPVALIRYLLEAWTCPAQAHRAYVKPAG